MTTMKCSEIEIDSKQFSRLCNGYTDWLTLLNVDIDNSISVGSMLRVRGCDGITYIVEGHVIKVNEIPCFVISERTNRLEQSEEYHHLEIQLKVSEE